MGRLERVFTVFGLMGCAMLIVAQTDEYGQTLVHGWHGLGLVVALLVAMAIAITVLAIGDDS